MGRATRSAASRSTASHTTARHVVRFALAGTLLFTGIGHLTWGRRGFRAAVPPYVPFDKDTVVVGSGIVEIALGAALATAHSQHGRQSAPRRPPSSWRSSRATSPTG